MKISTKGRYALRAMVDMANSDKDEYIPLRNVAENQDISVKYLEQIVGQLTKAGLLYSVRGPNGGYKLAKEPHQYTVAEILRVTEGELATVACLENNPNDCPRAATCSTLWLWDNLTDIVSGYLSKVTLAELVEQQLECEQKEIPI